jgi:hypothetical protein
MESSSFSVISSEEKQALRPSSGVGVGVGRGRCLSAACGPRCLVVGAVVALAASLALQAATLHHVYNSSSSNSSGATGTGPPRVVYEGTCPPPPSQCPADGGGCVPVCTAADVAAPRARDLGVPFVGTPGTHNAITDVAGVLVGHATQVCGADVRTGVTALLPRGIGGNPVAAGFYSLSGNGEMTGIHWVQEFGCLAGPIMLTNTYSVGSVHQAVVRYSIPLEETYPQFFFALPVVAETWDGYLNNMELLSVQQV